MNKFITLTVICKNITLQRYITELLSKNFLKNWEENQDFRFLCLPPYHPVSQFSQFVFKEIPNYFVRIFNLRKNKGFLFLRRSRCARKRQYRIPKRENKSDWSKISDLSPLFNISTNIFNYKKHERIPLLSCIIQQP